MKKWIVCENLRSAYNVGNIIRTADALGRGVLLLGYTARPHHPGVKKTALGAENAVEIVGYDDLSYAYSSLRSYGTLISLEVTVGSIPLTHDLLSSSPQTDNLYVIVGNEVSGIESATLSLSDFIVSIPMLGTKESLNVGQAAAIAMREFQKL